MRLYRDNGKENGSYYLWFPVLRFPQIPGLISVRCVKYSRNQPRRCIDQGAQKVVGLR